MTACPKCGEVLLGAVNRCWKCGQAFTAPPEQPIAAIASASANEPIEAVVVASPVGDASTAPLAAAGVNPFRTTPQPSPYSSPPRRPTTAEMIEARRAGAMAMGGTVGSLVLGLLASAFAFFWPPAAIVAVLGLAMGVWGLYSPRRNLALVGMLLCCLAIGLGAYAGVRNVMIYVQQNKPISSDLSPDPAES